MEEIWKDIQGYEGLYQVSNLGRVKRNYRENIDSKGRKRIFNESIIKPNIDKGGYFYVNLYKNGKKEIQKNHRLVCNTFIANPENKPQVNHIDGNKENNNVNNLEWVTIQENIQHAYKNNLIKSLKIELNEMDLKILIGTENAGMTAFIIPIVSTFLAMFLSKKISRYNNKQIFSVTPVYINENLINIEFSGIFQIQMIHIINTICIFNKKKRKGDKNERTSNRRAYDYSYE